MLKRFLKFYLIGLMFCGVLFLCACSSNEASIVNEIGTIITGILPIVTGVASVLLPGEAIAITAAATIASNGIKAVENLIHGYKAAPGAETLAQVQAGFTDAQANLAQLMAAAQVKDPTTQAKITAIVTAATQSLAAIESSMLAKHPATVASAS